jgi:MerR family transcriptional regulator, redox-sensitive transcriptional activator SoxR
MTIGDLSRRTGVPQSALRYYESVGLMRAPARVSGRRVYDPNAVTQVQVISAARELGFGVREIRTLVEQQSAASITDRWRALARRKLPELTALIDRAGRMKQMLETGLHCGCARIEDCVLHGCAPSTPLIQIRTSRPRPEAL